MHVGAFPGDAQLPIAFDVIRVSIAASVMHPSISLLDACRFIALASLCASALLMSGCGTRSYSAARLPVHGASPLKHTVYLGTDSENHHFYMVHEKSSWSATVPAKEAAIHPHAFAVGSDRHAFVKSASDSIIELLIFVDE